MNNYSIKNKFLVYLSLLLIICFVSCNDDEDSFGSGKRTPISVNLETTSLNNFDIDHEMAIKIIEHESTSLTVSSIEVTASGNSVQATISGDTATFSSSVLGNLTDKDVGVDVITTLSDGLVFRYQFNVEVSKTLSLVDEVSEIKFMYAPEFSKCLSYADTLSFKTSTKSAVIDNIKLEWKNGKNGAYTATDNPSSAMKFNVEKDFISFTNLESTTYGYGLNVKDTLFYRLIATSNTLKDTLTINPIPIISQTFDEIVSAKIYENLAKNELSLDSIKNYKDGDNLGEIKFRSPTGFERIGTNIDFVKVVDSDLSSINYIKTTEELFKEQDLLVAKQLYESATKTTFVERVVKKDLFIYKIIRTDVVVGQTGDKCKEDVIGDATEYGFIKIGDLTSLNGVEEISIEYGEGEIK